MTKKVRIKDGLMYYDAVLVGDIVIPMWETFKEGDIIVTYGDDSRFRHIHIVKQVLRNGMCYVYATLWEHTCHTSIYGKTQSCIKAPHVRKANINERAQLFNMLQKEGYHWNEVDKKLEKIEL